jgi:hypothetical protein
VTKTNADVLVPDRCGKCCGARRLVVSCEKLDPGKPDLAAIIQAKAAAVDDLGDVPLALLFERTSGRACRRRRRREQGHREGRCGKPAHRHHFAVCFAGS